MIFSNIINLLKNKLINIEETLEMIKLLKKTEGKEIINFTKV